MKAIALLSGGLDSILATKLILEQGIEIEAVNFVTVFCNCTAHNKSCLASRSAANQLGIKVKVFEISSDYFQIIKNPRYGYGRNLNPCLDCRIFMFKKATEYMKEVGASFIVTGEVLGERPMSQRKEAMRTIETDSGLEGLIVRPLSAKLLKPSIPEEKGWVDREKFLNIQGRSRKPQFRLANDLGINDYPCPAGGCLLTDNGFAKKMLDLMKQEPVFGVGDVKILKMGRLFRLSKEAKLIVGRNENDNNRLLNMAKGNDVCFRTLTIPGPVGIGRGSFDDDRVRLASRIIARYSDIELDQKLDVSYNKLPDKTFNLVTVSPLEKGELDNLRI